MDVRTLSLGVLTHGPMTGYEIKKCLEENFRHFVQASYGSIYPALAELAAEGLVTVASVEQERRPDKKVYALTESGRERLVADLLATAPRHRVRSDFLVLMCFAHLLPRDKVEASVDAMIDQYDRWLHHELEACERTEPGQILTAGERFAIGYGRTVLNAALAYLKRQRDPFLRDFDAERQAAGDAALPQAAE